MIKITFTGHRPDKLAGYNYSAKGNVVLMQTIADEIDVLIKKENAVHFITGGALGVDQMAFAVAYHIKKKHPKKKIFIELAMPFENMHIKWMDGSVKTHNKHKALADKVTVVCEGEYAAYKMQKRNMYMVDNSDVVIAVWNGTEGGTYNCVKYANSVNKKVINIWDDYCANMLL